MVNINFYGDLFSETGYASHCRGLLEGLHKAGHNIKIECFRPQGWERFVNDWQLEGLNKVFMPEGTSIVVATPPFWPYYLTLKPKHFIGFCVFEGDKIPKDWLKYLADERVDQIWVPSQHVMDAIINTTKLFLGKFDTKTLEAEEYTSMINKIRIVPHGHSPESFYPDRKNSKLYNPDLFTFIANKGWARPLTDRGGLQYLFEAFSKEFKGTEPVRLLAKINTAYNMPNFNVENFMNMLPLDRESKAMIQVYPGQLDTTGLREFYNAGNVFVCPTRAEAFDLCSAEAMACGLPVITTNYGGQIEHMNDECALFCDYKMGKVEDDILYEGVSWATIDITDLRKKMRWCFENQDRIRKMGQAAQRFISDNYTWKQTGLIAREFLEELKS